MAYAYKYYPTLIIPAEYTTPALNCALGNSANYYFNLSNYPNVLNDLLAPANNPAPFLEFQTDLGSPTPITAWNKNEDIYTASTYCNDEEEIPNLCIGHFTYKFNTDSWNLTSNGDPTMNFDDNNFGYNSLIPALLAQFISSGSCNGLYTYVKVSDFWDFDDGTTYSINSIQNPSLYNMTEYSHFSFNHNFFPGSYNICHRKTIEFICDNSNWDLGPNTPVITNICEKLIDCEICQPICITSPIIHDNVPLEKKAKQKRRSTDSKLIINPNPVNEICNVIFNSANSGVYTVKLLSNDGKVVYQQNNILKKGENSFEINTSKINSGLYTLEINNSLEKSIGKVIVYH